MNFFLFISGMFFGALITFIFLCRFVIEPLERDVVRLYQIIHERKFEVQFWKDIAAISTKNSKRLIELINEKQTDDTDEADWLKKS